ncbi:hypothetical protein BC830DRAFT_1171797, partial [Chytriomyces sp. MP71]
MSEENEIIEAASDTKRVADEPVTAEQDFWATMGPVAACGVGLFSDGYINSVIGS